MNKRSLLATALALVLASTTLGAAEIIPINVDGPGEGYNDLTVVAPVGGNPGTTLGEQRRIVAQFAADLWGAVLKSNVPILITAEFNPLAPNVLGSAGSNWVFSNFTNAPVAGTWYSSALADAISNVDQYAGQTDISSRFSSTFTFYYGLDGITPAGQVNFLDVVMHEYGHGLGFQNFENEAAGTFLSGVPDIYSTFTYDNTTGKRWTQMTIAERQASAVNYGKVIFDGTSAVNGAKLILGPRKTFRAFSPAPAAGDYDVGTSTTFGPVATAANFTGNAVMGLDASNASGTLTTDGCTALTNAAAVAGKIAMIDRGTCGFTVKVKNAQNAGAIGVIILNAGATAAQNPPPGMGGADATVTIPAVLVTKAAGDVFRVNTPVSVGFVVDYTKLQGADNAGRPRLYMPNPVVGGSSGSHYDTALDPNAVMEPAINGSLRSGLNIDISANLLKDTGWPLNTANAKLAGCDTGIDVINDTGIIIGANVEANSELCLSKATTQSQYKACMVIYKDKMVNSGLITRTDGLRMMTCAGTVRVTP